MVLKSYRVKVQKVTIAGHLACENPWEPAGPHYCVRFVMPRLSWDAARVNCHDSRGFLVDELSKDKDDWITGFFKQYIVLVSNYFNKSGLMDFVFICDNNDHQEFRKNF